MLALAKEALLNAYRVMKTIRELEERVSVELAAGSISGVVHLYTGQEACAVGVCEHLSPGDSIASTHRGHGHCIAKGVDVHAMMAELFGRASGVCGGKGGSMHIADIGLGVLGANGIVGAGPALACGAALAAKQQRNGRVAVAFLGDGATNQGTALESLNLAKIWSLPVVFVVEDNGYAESTSSRYALGAENNTVRARGFGLPATRVDGSDFFAVYEAAGEAVARAREGRGPSLLECSLVRYRGHFEGDAQTYRAPHEVEEARRSRDCIDAFVERVVAAGAVDRSELQRIDEGVLALIEASVIAARAAPRPPAEALFTNVYGSY